MSDITKQRIDKALSEINTPAYAEVGQTPPSMPYVCCTSCVFSGWDKDDLFYDDMTLVAYHEQDADSSFSSVPGPDEFGGPIFPEDSILIADLFLAWNGDPDRIAQVLRAHGLTVTVPPSGEEKFIIRVPHLRAV
jgi:hypothetical protein